MNISSIKASLGNNAPRIKSAKFSNPEGIKQMAAQASSQASSQAKKLPVKQLGIAAAVIAATTVAALAIKRFVAEKAAQKTESANS